MPRRRANVPAPTAGKVDLTKLPARVDRVIVSGLSRTHNDYVMKAAEGLFKVTNFQDVMLEAMNANSYLNELGIFKEVNIKIDVSHAPDATPNGYEVTFKGKELSRLVGSIGTEVGQNEGSLRTELTIPNIFGRGESLALQGSYSSTRANDVTLKFWKSFFHTRLFENRPEFSLSVFRHIDRMDISSFQNSNLGLMGDFSISTFFPFQLRHSFQYESSVREISILGKSVPFAIREHCGPRLASVLRYIVGYDQRDNPVFPSQGIMVKSTSEYSGLGGNISYMSNNTHAEVSVPVIGGIVAQLCGRIGIVNPTKSSSDLPISNLFYVGGPQTLRGFRFGGAGPRVDGTAIGAQSYWSAGFHLWSPLPFSGVFKGLSNNFRTHLFYNLGNFNSFTTENMRSAAGIGLAFKLAQRARIELNYCVPIQKYQGDKTVNGFQFGIGYEFV
ncbi:SAM50-like protein CG7639 [Episyrphus balteatus]|uniref:SAM50-like protein CG7639 n=1 Tax=Episyrphus balteatus TaxID=286459 RepID=UPI0024869AF2|nr:SAM50-like protein CG7639 [Episyrphus balteatus]